MRTLRQVSVWGMWGCWTHVMHVPVCVCFQAAPEQGPEVGAQQHTPARSSLWF